MMRKLVLLQLTLSWLFAANAIATQPNEEEEKKKGGFTLDVALGWTATRGNDVQIGHQTTVGDDNLFDESTTFTPLTTRMDSDFSPLVRAGYAWEKWGVQGEYWQIETGGSLEGSFENRRRGRTELVQLWDYWHGEFDDATSYAAQNDLSLRSLRVDLTRTVARNLSFTIGLHVAKYENTRAEEVTTENFFGPISIEETLDAPSLVEGWLYGPSVGLRGSADLGQSAHIGFSLSQSVLFTELDHEDSWERLSTLPSMPVIAVEAVLSSRAAVPVTDVRGDLMFDLGDHVSVGGFMLLSVWYDLPMARGFSMPLEQWEAPKSTLVFASFGPMVRIRF
jgi:hypothetical protein